jgi:hypothetical protein
MKYDLILSDTDNEVGVEEKRVKEYARNRVLANLDEAIEDIFFTSWLDILLEVAPALPKEIESLVGLLENESSRDKIISVLMRDFISDEAMDLGSAKSIISYFDEDVTFSTASISFEEGRSYSYSKISSLVEKINSGVGDSDYNELVSLEYFGKEVVGEHFVTVKVLENDSVHSFVMDGATSNDYIMRCVYKDKN